MPSPSIVKDRRADGLNLRIDGHGYALNLDGFKRLPIAAQRQLVDDGEEPGDRSINGQGNWKRTAWSADHGAGQTWWDEDEDADRRQYRTSIGVDVWDRRQVKLLHDTELKGPYPVHKIVPKGEGAYVLIVTTLAEVADAAGSWAGSTIASNVIDFCYDGEFLYYATPTGVISTLGGFTNTDVVTSLFVSGGLVLAIRDNELVTFFADGSTQVVDTAPTGYRWGGVVDMGGETYSWAIPTIDGLTDDVNGRSTLYRHSPGETDGTLDPGDPVLQLPPAEFITAAYGFANAIVVGTSRGIRVVQPTSGTDMAHGGLIPIPLHQGMDRQIRDFCAQGQFCWFTWTRPEEGYVGLGRLDLDEFIEFGVAAYAPDIVGLEVYEPGVTQVSCCASINGRRYFGGDFGIYGETDEYVSEGNLYSGFVNFGSPEQKAVLSLGLRGLPLSQGEEIRGTVLVNNGQSVPQGVVAMIGRDAVGATGSVGAAGDPIQGEEFEVLITLIRGEDPEHTPNLRRWTLRCLPMPFRAEEIVLPIHVTPRVSEVGINLTQDADAVMERLRQLYQDRTLVRLDLGNESMMVYIDGLGVGEDNTTTKANGFTPDGVMTGIWAVTAITTDVPVHGDQTTYGVEA